MGLIANRRAVAGFADARQCPGGIVQRTSFDFLRAARRRVGSPRQHRRDFCRRYALGLHDRRRNSGDAGNPQLCRRAEWRPLSPPSFGVSRVSQRRTVRLISNAKHKPPVLERLASSYGAPAPISRRPRAPPARDGTFGKKAFRGWRLSPFACPIQWLRIARGPCDSIFCALCAVSHFQIASKGSIFMV